MKTIALLFLLFALVGKMTWARSLTNLNKAGVALGGYDVVSYFKPGGPLIGVSTNQVEQAGAVYWFANEENKQLFIQDPKKYEPQFGGWCAYAVADSKSKVEVDPKSFLIQDGRLLLFYNGFWANTREKWLHGKDKDPATYLKEADANWPAVKDKEGP